MRKRYTLKAGCILININTKKIGIIYRKKHNDYEFPKGHLEFNENIQECAIRETAEETKRDVILINNFKPIIASYRTKKKEYCKCYYFLAIDDKKSDNNSFDTHKLIWIDVSQVSNNLTHKNLKILWKKALPKINLILNNDN